MFENKKMSNKIISFELDQFTSVNSKSSDWSDPSGISNGLPTGESIHQILDNFNNFGI